MNSKLKFTVGAEESLIRLDVFLSKKIPSITRSQIKKNISFILVNGRVRKQSTILNEGDEIIVLDVLTKAKRLIPSRENIDIVYEDSDLLIVNKAPFLLTHPSTNLASDSLANRLIGHYENLPTLQGKDRPGIVHRLDRDTSGLIVIAKNEEVQKKLIEMFKERKIQKTYLALAFGHLKESQGEIELPLQRGKIHRTKMKVDTSGRYALTAWKVLEEFIEVSLLEIMPRTGRTHQIRAHLKEIGHPIVGDHLYAGKRALKSKITVPRHMLHAWKLELNHPISGENLKFTAPLPKDFADLLRLLESNCEKNLK